MTPDDAAFATAGMNAAAAPATGEIGAKNGAAAAATSGRDGAVPGVGVVEIVGDDGGVKLRGAVSVGVEGTANPVVVPG